MIRVKVCGITRLEDALAAAESGMWAVGFVFVRGTPRFIEPEKALKIIENLPKPLEKTGVFADSSLNKVKEVSQLANITKIQLHGDETPEFCAEVSGITGKEVIKAFPMSNINDIEQIVPYKASVSYILLDTHSKTQKGGTGKTFDWNIAKAAKQYDLPLILAGGLNPDNILKAYLEVKPFALDLSSGLEVSRGIKDPEKIRELGKICCQNS